MRKIEPLNLKEKNNEEQWYQDWIKTEEFKQKVKEAQKIAGEVLWLTTRTRPETFVFPYKECLVCQQGTRQRR